MYVATRRASGAQFRISPDAKGEINGMINAMTCCRTVNDCVSGGDKKSIVSGGCHKSTHLLGVVVPGDRVLPSVGPVSFAVLAEMVESVTA